MSRPTSRNRILRTALLCFAMLASTTGLLTFQIQTAQASPSTLVINEIYDSQTPANEYFELYNNSATAVNLSTYRIYNHDGSTPLSNLDNPVIGPGEFRAIGPTQLHTPTIAGTGIARVDFLGLVNTSPSDTVVDVVNFGGGPNPNWPNYDRFSAYFFPSGTQPALPAEDGVKSLQRFPDGRDTDQGSDFAAIASSPGAPSCADPNENDNALAAAVNQDVGTTVLHRLCPTADQDWISISMSASFTYTLAANAVGSQVDTVLTLYDSSGTLIAQDNNPASRNSLINFRPTTSGTFKVQITDANNAGGSGAAFLYNFSVTASTAATPTPSTSVTATPIGCADQYEPDNTRTTAKTIELNTEQIHTFCPPGDLDWVTFVAVGGKVYTMYTKDLAGPVDTVITLYDSAGNFLFENDDYQPGQGLASRIDYTFASTAVYYLRVRDKRNSGGAGYQYTVGLSSTGALPSTGTATVTPTLNPNTATPTPGNCNDQYEPDGVPEAAKLFLIGSVQHHVICPAADADWVRFYARAGKVYTVRTLNLGVGLDTYMYVFDSDGQKILAQNDDGGDGVASRIDFYPQRDDWYYAQVKNAGDIGSPDQTYDLSLAVVPGVPQPPGTATQIIAPVVTGTETLPTTVVQPTKPPLNTPTQGAIEPTPAAKPTLPQPGATQPPMPTAAPTEAPAEPTPVIPNPPITGHEPFDPTQVAHSQAPAKVIAPPQPAASVGLAPMLFRLFYDRNHNDSYEAGEGIRGISVYFLYADASLALSGSAVTSDAGVGELKLPATEQMVYIPYLDIKMKVARFPQRELHSLWLPPVALPDHVP